MKLLEQSPFFNQLKVICGQIIESELKKRLLNCDIKLFERRLWLLETQVKNYTNIVEDEGSAIRSEREQLSDILNHVKEFEIQIDERIKELEKACNQ